MSLIFGANLCDRIYIAADTRLTSKDGSGTILSKKDKLMKVVILSDNIALAAAGNAKMASYLIRKLLKSDLVKLNIREAREQITGILAPVVDDYWRESKSNDKVCFIFGGINKEAKKKLDAKRIHEEILFYREQEGGANSSMNAKPAIFNMLVEKKYEEPCDSSVFSISISPPSTFDITDTEWGEYLAFGPNGITKDSIPKVMLGKLEFDAKQNDHIGLGQDNTVIVAMVHSIVEERKEETIGDTVTTVAITENFTALIGGATFIWDRNPDSKAKHLSEIVVVAGTVYRKDEKGQMFKLTSLKDFKDYGNLEMTI